MILYTCAVRIQNGNNITSIESRYYVSTGHSWFLIIVLNYTYVPF